MFRRYGEELEKLEKVTLQCIQETLQAMEDTTGKPFNPKEMFHLLIEHILAILVRKNRESSRLFSIERKLILE